MGLIFVGRFVRYCYRWKSIVAANMVSTRMKTQQHGLFLRHLDDFEQDVFFGDAANSGQQKFVVKNGTNDREVTVSNSGSISTTRMNTVNVQTMEKCFNEKNDSEVGNTVDTVEDRIQNAIWTAIDNIVTPRVELAVRSMLLRHLGETLPTSWHIRSKGNV